MQVTAFERDWLRNENAIIPLPVLLGTGSYTILSSIPVPAFPEGGFYGAFVSKIGEELAHFPTPPAADSDFW